MQCSCLPHYVDSIYQVYYIYCVSYFPVARPFMFLSIVVVTILALLHLLIRHKPLHLVGMLELDTPWVYEGWIISLAHVLRSRIIGLQYKTLLTIGKILK